MVARLLIVVIIIGNLVRNLITNGYRYIILVMLYNYITYSYMNTSI